MVITETVVVALAAQAAAPSAGVATAVGVMVMVESAVYQGLESCLNVFPQGFLSYHGARLIQCLGGNDGDIAEDGGGLDIVDD